MSQAAPHDKGKPMTAKDIAAAYETAFERRKGFPFEQCNPIREIQSCQR
jgi:hypothetical protein